ncbi:hypothetical protein N9260_00445 [bacterium]|nr:hypothetical protein [bacterium]
MNVCDGDDVGFGLACGDPGCSGYLEGGSWKPLAGVRDEVNSGGVDQVVGEADCLLVGLEELGDFVGRPGIDVIVTVYASVEGAVAAESKPA